MVFERLTQKVTVIVEDPNGKKVTMVWDRATEVTFSEERLPIPEPPIFYVDDKFLRYQLPETLTGWGIKLTPERNEEGYYGKVYIEEPR